MFETGMQVIDLLTPYLAGEDWPLRCGRGQDRAHHRDD